jgi:hypothetical protein
MRPRPLFPQHGRVHRLHSGGRLRLQTNENDIQSISSDADRSITQEAMHASSATRLRTIRCRPFCRFPFAAPTRSRKRYVFVFASNCRTVSVRSHSAPSHFSRNSMDLPQTACSLQRRCFATIKDLSGIVYDLQGVHVIIRISYVT